MRCPSSRRIRLGATSTPSPRSTATSTCRVMPGRAGAPSRNAALPNSQPNPSRSLELVEHIRASLLVPAALAEGDRHETMALVKAARALILLKGVQTDWPPSDCERVREQARADASA